MILCAVDDLIFSVKISTTAKAVGADIFFERNPDLVLNRIREKRPSLVIFDLNSDKMRPLDALAQIKSRPDLYFVRTVGYVSHVDSGAIAAARKAGIDQVFSRSAFVDRMVEILTTA